MPAEIKAIIYEGLHDRTYSSFQYHPPGYLLVSGLTAGDIYYTKIYYAPYSSGVTVGSLSVAGKFIASTATALAPFQSTSWIAPQQRGSFYDYPTTSSSTVSISLFAIHNSSNVTVATAFVSLSYPYTNAEFANWSVTQTSQKNVTVKMSSLNSVSSWSVLHSLEQSNDRFYSTGEQLPQSKPLYRIDLINNKGTVLGTEEVSWQKDGDYPEATFPASLIAATDNYIVKISNKILYSNQSTVATLAFQEIASVLTAPSADTGGGGGGTTAMFSWLNNDYWYLTDLQVNLGTRAVTHRQGTIQIKPNDTVQFGVFFHDGSTGKDPVATDLRLAVRSASNASAYYFWANPSVTTTSVSGDIYYTITVTASDEDLLAAQALNLVGGSSGSQNLLAEVQWTTTRGTFSSDTFTIRVPSEVIREPDV